MTFKSHYDFLKTNFRFFYAKAVHKTWTKLYVLDSTGRLYSEFLDFMKPAIDQCSVDYNSFKAEDYSFEGYQHLREVTFSELEKAKLTRQENWVLDYVSSRIEELKQ